jgi:hypothetical protein
MYVQFTVSGGGWGRTGVRICMCSLSSVTDVGVEKVSGYVCTVYHQWRMLG